MGGQNSTRTDSVEAFRQREAISVASFYRWRGLLGAQDPRTVRLGLAEKNQPAAGPEPLPPALHRGQANVIFLGGVGLGKSHLGHRPWLTPPACAATPCSSPPPIDIINALSAAQARRPQARTPSISSRDCSSSTNSATCPSTSTAPTCSSRSSANATSAAPSPHHQQALQALARDLQQRQHADLSAPRSPPPSRRNRRHRRQKLSNEGPDRGLIYAVCGRSSGTNFKPPVSDEIHAAAHTLS